MLSDVREGGGLASVLDVQSLFFFVKKNWIFAMTRHQISFNDTIVLFVE